MKTNPILTNSIELEVPFFDVDAMHVVWHGHYVKYLELARCELLKLFDYNYPQMQESGYAWPIVDMRIKYVASARMTDIIIVESSLVEYETRLKIEYVIKDKATEKVLTKAFTIQVAVGVDNGEMLLEAPTCLIKKLAPFLT